LRKTLYIKGFCTKETCLLIELSNRSCPVRCVCVCVCVCVCIHKLFIACIEDRPTICLAGIRCVCSLSQKSKNRRDTGETLWKERLGNLRGTCCRVLQCVAMRCSALLCVPVWVGNNWWAPSLVRSHLQKRHVGRAFAKEPRHFTADM